MSKFQLTSLPFAPAPGTYKPETFQVDHPPSYTFGSRAAPAKADRTPAPGAYEPEKVCLDHAPAFTFGIKTHVTKFNDTPAPGTYETEKVCLDHVPSYVFHKSVIQPQGYIK